MEMIKNFISIFFLLALLPSFNIKNLFHLIDNQKINEKEFLIVSYQYPVNCIKCFIESDEIINYLNKKKPNKFKIIGLVVCDRDVELKSFVKSNDWKYPAFRIKSKDLKNLYVNNKTMMQIFNHNKKKVLELNYEDKTTNQKIQEFLKTIL